MCAVFLAHTPFLSQQGFVEDLIEKLASDVPDDFAEAQKKQATRFQEIVAELTKMAAEAQSNVKKDGTTQREVRDCLPSAPETLMPPSYQPT